MSLVIKFYFASSMLNMFRTLTHPSSGACDFSIVSPHCWCVLVLMCVGVSVWLGWGGIRVARWSTAQPATRIPTQPSHTKTPTHIETRTHHQCGDTIEKSQAPDDGWINLLTPNVNYTCRTAPLTSKVAFSICIQQIYLLNILNMVYTLRFFSLQNAVCFIILTYLVPVLFTFYIQGVLKFKK